MQEKPQTEHFLALDSLRGICALLVAVFHFGAYWHFYNASFVRGAWLFLDFFFVLSGFVVTHAYMHRLGNGGEFRSFVIRRFGRLWPLHIATLLVLVAPELIKFLLLKFGGFTSDRPAFAGSTGIDALIANIFLVHGLGFYDDLTWNTVSWSISTEFWTYLVFAAVVLLARTARAMLICDVALVAISLWVSIVTYYPGGMADAHFRYAIFRCVYGFFVGHIVYRLWMRGGISGLRSGWGLLEIFTCVLVAVFVAMAWHSMWALAAPVVFGFAVLVFAQERGAVSAGLKTKPFLFVGMLSYSIYMVHPLVLAAFGRIDYVVNKKMNIPTHIDVTTRWMDAPVSLYFFGNQWIMDGFGIVYLVCTIALAALTYTFVEKPGRDFFNRLAKTK